MEIEVVRTLDGSDTLFCRDLDQHYHSSFGALQESQHIFINSGLIHYLDCNYTGPGREDPVRVFEVGFGTGLNAILTFLVAEKFSIPVHYTCIEAYPLKEEFWATLNYPSLPDSNIPEDIFFKLHRSEWGTSVSISPFFEITKIHGKLEDFSAPGQLIDVIFFDAFGPEAQPELWTVDIFRQLAASLTPGGVLVTYSVKGTVVRALGSTGLFVEKLPGPPGKRHILRAKKQS